MMRREKKKNREALKIIISCMSVFSLSLTKQYWAVSLLHISRFYNGEKERNVKRENLARKKGKWVKWNGLNNTIFCMLVFFFYLKWRKFVNVWILKTVQWRVRRREKMGKQDKLRYVEHTLACHFFPPVTERTGCRLNIDTECKERKQDKRDHIISHLSVYFRVTKLNYRRIFINKLCIKNRRREHKKREEKR